MEDPFLDQADCQQCRKLFQMFEYSEILKLEYSDFKKLRKEICQHRNSVMDSEFSSIEHQDSLLSHFVLKLNMYLDQDHVYKFPFKILKQIFKLFSLFIISWDKFAKLHPKHHMSDKMNQLFLRFQLLRCYEIHGFVGLVETNGLSLLEEMKTVQLRHSDFGKIIIHTIQMLLSLPITNDSFLVRFTPLLKLAINYMRMEDDSGKRKVKQLLERIVDRIEILLKKAESSDIDRDSIELCCITLTLIKNSPFRVGIFKFAKHLCNSLLSWSDNSIYVKKILTTIKSDSKEVFCEVALDCAWMSRDTEFSKELRIYLEKIAEQEKGTPIGSILNLCVVGMLLSKSDLFDSLLETIEENVKILAEYSNSFSGWKLEYQHSYLDALIFIYSPLIASMDMHLLPHHDIFSTKVEKFLQSNARVMFDFLCQQLHHVYSLTHISDSSRWPVSDIRRINNNYIVLLAFAPSIRTNETSHVKEKIELFHTCVSMHEPNTEEPRNLFERLYNFSEYLKEKKMKEKAWSTLHLYCDGLLKYITVNVEILSQTELEDLLSLACIRSAQLLRDSDDPEKTIEFLLTSLLFINDKSMNLSILSHIVKRWVKIQCDLHEIDTDENVASLTLYCMLERIQLSKKNTLTILEEELMICMKLATEYPRYCKKMQIKVKCLLLQHVYTTPRCSETHTKKEKKTLMFYDGNNPYIQLLSEAIEIMENIYDQHEKIYGETKLTRDNPIAHQLCQAYCLHSLCTGECDPFSKTNCGDFMTISLLERSVMCLLHTLFDFLQLKGLNAKDVYLLLNKMYNLKNISIGKQLNLLWQSRRLSHPLCVSPVDKDSIKNLSDRSGQVPDIESWMHYFRKNNSASIGLQQNFSFLFPNFDNNSEGHEKSVHREITVCEVCNAANELILMNSSVPTFLAGYLYLDLCGRLVANGRLIEGLSYAKEAQRLHGSLVMDFSKNIMDMNISIAKEVFKFDSLLENLSDTYISPWKFLQGYLESTLQLGILYEMIGDGTEAGRCLREGEVVSKSLDLPLFVAVFSSILGKLDTQTTQCGLLDKTIFCCSNCQLFFEITLSEYTQKEDEENTFQSFLESLIKAKCPSSGICLNSDTEVLKCICLMGSECDENCAFSKMQLWPFLSSKRVLSWPLNDCIDLKWEFIRRKLLIRLHIRLGRCLANLGKIDEARQNFIRSISFLVGRNLVEVPSFHFPHLILGECPRDVFVVERAELIYNICWFTWKCCMSNNIFLDIIPVKDLVSWLMQAYLLCREVPGLLQKVSKLLAVMCTVSTVSNQNSVICDIPTLTNRKLCSYFHQASVGTHFTFQSRSHLSERCEGSSNSRSSVTRLLSFPTSIEEIAEHANQVLKGLSAMTIAVISLLENTYINLIQEIFSCKDIETWILVSRLSFEKEPVVVLLPVYSVTPDKKADTLIEEHFFVDGIVPDIRTFLQEHKSPYSASVTEKRWKIDVHLKELLRNLEDLWFGSWRCLLQGEPVNCKNFEAMFEKLITYLTSELKSDINRGLIKTILGGFCGKKQWTEKDCCIVGNYDEAMSGIYLKANNRSQECVFELLNKASCELKVDGDTKRDPIILVLDDKMLMLPLESFPVLRKEEVYRMPSVESIYTVFARYNNQKEQLGRNLISFPFIDPQNAFCLLNPTGDLKHCQTSFETFLKSNKLSLKQYKGCAPAAKELINSLQSYDLYLYMGHDGGEDHIPNCEIASLKKCSAAILSGCSSGIITAKRSYAPTGTPLSYLLAGSPFIVATLWDVFSKEIGEFDKAMYNVMLEERSNLLGDRIGTLVSKAREVCTKSYFTGASIVCYGVPTRIKNLKDPTRIRKREENLEGPAKITKREENL